MRGTPSARFIPAKLPCPLNPLRQRNGLSPPPCGEGWEGSLPYDGRTALIASSSRTFAEPGFSGFCWLSCGAQPER